MPNQDAVVWYLRVEQEQVGSVIVLTVSGRVSSLTVAQLETALDSAVGAAVRGVVLDLSGTDYISSAGLRSVEKASALLAETGRRLVVCGVTDAVRLAFNLAGLEDALPSKPSREQAVTAAGA